MDTVGLAAKGAVLLYQKFQQAAAQKEQAWVDQVSREMASTGYAVARALLAIALNCNPNDAQIDQFIGEVAADAAFPARVYRLLNDALRSPSKRKRDRLAAVLAGGLTVARTSDGRDRLDVLVERLLDEDIDALRVVCDLDASGVERVQVGDVDMTMCLWPDEGGYRLFRGTDLRHDGQPRPQTPDPAWPPLPHLAVGNLDSVGCIRVAESETVAGHIGYVGSGATPFHKPMTIALTETGRFLYNALKLLRTD